MVGKKFCAALCASSIAFSVVSKSEASWKAYNITSAVFQIVKDLGKMFIGAGVAGICYGPMMEAKENNNEGAALLFLASGGLGAVTFIDGFVSLLSDIGEIGNGITAGRAVESKEGLKELAKRTEALEKNANVNDSKAIEK